MTDETVLAAYFCIFLKFYAYLVSVLVVENSRLLLGSFAYIITKNVVYLQTQTKTMKSY